MSKKRNRPKKPSARGHVEGNVIRWREKKELIRVDREGNPIVRGKSPINTFDKNWLASHLNPEVSAPPTIPMKEPPPNNVTSIADARNSKASKPEPQPGNEAHDQESFANLSDDKAHDRSSFKPEHGWLHNKALAINEFKHWERKTKEIGRKRCGSELWINKDGKLSSPSLEKQRELSKQGHTKLKFKHPPSVNHNPFLHPSGGYAPDTSAAPISKLNQRNRIREGTEPLAPSGIPISVFVTGKHKPKNAVVYTALPHSSAARRAVSAPPTASKHWTASNDHDYDRSVKVRKTTGIRTDYMRLTGQVQWYVDNVDVQKWPLPMYRFVKFSPHHEKPLIDHKAIDKVAGDPQAELNVIKAMLHGMQRQYRMIDIALCDATSENNLLRQELELTQSELADERRAHSLMEYDLAMRNGEDPDTVREKYVIKSKTPVTDDADQLLSQFNLFNSFVKFDGLESAFTRYVYGDPKLGKTIREHADMRCKERESAVQYRNLVRMIKGVSNHILSEMQAEYEQQKYYSYVNFWKEQYPVYLKQRARRTIGVVRDPSRESVALAAMARKAKPATFSSIYYSTPVLYDERYRAVNNTIAKRILMDVKPTQPRYNNPRCVDHDTRESWAQPTFKGMASYEKWWAERLDWCEVHFHEIKHPVKVGVVKTYNWLVDKLNTPVDPATRSRQAKLREQLRQKQHELDEKREQRKEVRIAAKKRKAERDHIKKMQRIAY